VLDSRSPALTRPTPCPAGFPLTATGGPYDPLLKRLVNAHKERQVRSVTPVLAGQLAGAAGFLLRSSAPAHAGIALVPVPSSAAAVRERGFDANWALARRVAGELRGQGVDVVPVRLLQQRRGVRDQAGLDASARAANLGGRLRVGREPPRDRAILLIDDVVTTGSSLVEAARALRAGGLSVLGAATVAATVRFRANRSDDSRESRR
jgi:predicted amidophosphoribosyltransferase